MSKDLVVTDNTLGSLMEYMPEHADMVKTIEASMPEITRGTSFFGKKQTQFMDNMLTVNHPEPLRNVRQILSEITRAKDALREVHFKNKKKEINIRKKMRELEKCTDELDKEFVGTEIDEMRSELAASEVYVSGAIRRITNLLEQYESIKKEHDITDYNEQDVEAAEERYHIKKAFQQGMSAARSNPSGMIDEGNLIYMQQIGVNGMLAQRCLSNYFKEESEYIGLGGTPKRLQILEQEFLNEMVEKFDGCAEKLANSRGMQTKSNSALLTEGDTRLIENKGE